ncbi:hypothetical protein HC891_26195, partial [Candidatus Gracilibacteria bacterium]|nr:hypothetical protein [Candidatus Gracilibacteria bacterium]
MRVYLEETRQAALAELRSARQTLEERNHPRAVQHLADAREMLEAGGVESAVPLINMLTVLKVQLSKRQRGNFGQARRLVGTVAEWSRRIRVLPTDAVTSADIAPSVQGSMSLNYRTGLKRLKDALGVTHADYRDVLVQEIRLLEVLDRRRLGFTSDGDA